MLLGQQFVVDLYDCNPDIISHVDGVRSALLKAAELSGAHIVDNVFHQFSPYGVSGVVVIAESHLAIHTWPEHSYCAVDYFTCSKDIDWQRAFESLKEDFESSSYDVKEIKREIHN
ncbi:adenosylmethionine decarboxylase, partial [Spirochaeta cellobiosiphila]|uniref:adenosylmethionine decarboxylase n=1 Tax=Spirochaeta cellobiosiphila TaxID=504483 RepID=UPI0003FD24E5